MLGAPAYGFPGGNHLGYMGGQQVRPAQKKKMNLDAYIQSHLASAEADEEQEKKREQDKEKQREKDKELEKERELARAKAREAKLEPVAGTPKY